MDLANSSLNSFLDSKKITEKIMKNICQSLIKNLIAMHDMKLVHRDLKPANILVQELAEESEIFLLGGNNKVIYIYTYLLINK